MMPSDRTTKPVPLDRSTPRSAAIQTTDLRICSRSSPRRGFPVGATTAGAGAGAAFAVFSVCDGAEGALAGGGVGLRNIRKAARRTRARTPPVLPPKSRILVFGSISFAAGFGVRAAVPLGGFF